ncbi:MAG: sensor histidine kinase [Alphaproteobacteria bacterium]|nr:MAG: sensor histidine kinase [Alphaproteobacteria bacterium]
MMQLFGRLPLALRVPLLVAVLMLTVAAAASQQVLTSLDRLQAARIRELARLHVEALAVALGPHVLREDIWEVYDTLERAAGQGEGRRTVFSAVSDTEGRVIAATDPRRAPVDSPIAPLTEGAVRPEELSVSRGTGSVKLYAPLFYQGRHVGNILTELDISDILAERARAERLLILGNMLAALTLAAFGYLIIGRTLRPLTTVVSRMQAAEGAPEPVPASEIPKGDTEMARLARSYNAMVEAVEAKAETERRLAERERFVSLGRLSSSLAHEINNPLGGLLNATDTIRRYADRPEVVRQSAELIERGLKHMRDVAKATLEVNRMERADQPLTPEDFDDLELLIRPEILHNGQRLDWEVDLDADAAGALPAAPVRQVVLNLLLNAAKAAGRGGTVSLAARQEEGVLRLVFRDSGPGLDEQARERLLGSGPVPPGGGVGLRMVRELVSRLGGEISVGDAESQGGALIEVRLPLAPATQRQGVAAC